ncbi:unnamed protein product [Periconia digitata]|uniref:Uncharacterized protein n=1 Tax=Periconia digitata TaxID=1303443 RepID=A0A9W4XKK9_9PLEO|nr:unnamed protein product [Periconia digitata]
MAGFIQNMIWNSVEGFVEAGKRTVGGYAGDALIKAGDAIENGGRSVGTGLERKVSGYGNTISGQKYQGSSHSSAPKKKALPAPSKPSAPKRSNSSPASSVPSNMKRLGPTSSTPLGAKKVASGGAKSAQKSLTNGVNTGKSVVGGGFGGAKGALGSTANKAASTTNLAGNTASKATKSLPKPYPQNNSALSYPTEKKSAVKPGAPKPFTPPASSNFNKNSAKKDVSPYPGTNTKPGEANTAPVRRKFKPMERAAPQTEHGKMQHIAV